VCRIGFVFKKKQKPAAEQETRKNRGVEQFKYIAVRIFIFFKNIFFKYAFFRTKRDNPQKSGRGTVQCTVVCGFEFFLEKFLFFERKKETNLKNRGVEQFKVQWCADFGRKQKRYPSRSLRIHFYFFLIFFYCFIFIILLIYWAIPLAL
jgi:hypothetical protein